MNSQLIYPYCGVRFTSDLNLGEVAELISAHLLKGVPLSESFSSLESPCVAIKGTFLGMKARVNQLDESTFGFSLECDRLDLVPMSDELNLDLALSGTSTEAERFPYRANLSNYVAALLDEIEGIHVNSDFKRPAE